VLEQRRPVAVRVEQDDRAVVVAELLQRDDLDELLERADAAGEDHEGVALGVHAVLALPHRVGADELGDLRQGDLAGGEAVRDDAEDLPAGAIAARAASPMSPIPPPP
jgi:hypothetical protein